MQIPRLVGVLGVLAALVGGWSHGIGTGGGGVTPVAGVYYLAPGGSDGADGQVPGRAWASPAHALNCGDVVHMQPGSYDPANFAAGKWGSVANCPAATNGSFFATLICDGPNVQDCAIPGNGGNAVQITASNWQMIGGFASANYANGNCFVAGDGTTTYHHIAFINVYARNCGAGVQANKVDYVAYVGLLAYGGDVTGQCFKGYELLHPVNVNTIGGTHVFTAGAFVLNTNSTAGCGDGVSINQWDHTDDTSIVYTGQGAIEQSLIIGNAAWCLVPNAVAAPLRIRNVSCWGNFRDGNRFQNAELFLSTTGNTQITNSIFQATLNQIAGSVGTPTCANPANGAVFGALYQATTAVNSISNSYVFGVGALDECVWPGSVAPTRSTITNANPGFAGAQQISAAPNCSLSTTVTACIAGVRANFQPSGGAAALGYQPPTACSADTLWPDWLAVRDIPANLVTTPCAGPVVAITAPANNASIAGVLNASALCVAPCDQVVFQFDGVTFATDAAPPYVGSFDTTTVANGFHTLTAIGSLAGVTTRETLAVTVNNVGVGPTVAITAPANNATVSGSIPITATCTPVTTPACSVEFQIDNNPFATVVAAPYNTSFNTATLPDGPHTLKAIGTNNIGSSNVSVALTFNNTQPQAGVFYINTVAAGANDANDGQTPTVTGGHGPWRTVNHAIQCGQTIKVQPGTYPGAVTDSQSQTWQTPTGCTAGNLYAKLTCNSTTLNCIFDGTTDGSRPFQINASNWAISGMTAINNKAPGSGSTAACFVLGSDAATRHHLLLINSYAHDCTWSLSSTQGDYVGYIGVLLFHGAYDRTVVAPAPDGTCPSNDSDINPVSFDTLAGPHRFYAGYVSLRAGPSAPNCVDGHGLIFDGWSTTGYNKPWVIQQSIFAANALTGFHVFASVSTAGKLLTSTIYGNHQSTNQACGNQIGELSSGSAGTAGAGTVTIDHNIVQATVQNQTCTAWPGNAGVGPIPSPAKIYAIADLGSANTSWTVTNTDYLGVGGQNVCPEGTGGGNPGNFCNAGTGFINGTGNTNQDPGFGNALASIPAATAAPNCSADATVYACIHRLGIDTALQPAAGTVAATQVMGYRPPGPCAPNDPNWPTSWIPQTLIPANLVTMPCAGPSVTVSPASINYTVGGAAQVLNSGLVVNDPLVTNLTSAAVSITSGFVSGDTLGFANQSGISGSYNSATGVLSLSGSSSVANYQAALRSITFSSNAAVAGTTRTIRWVVNE